MAMKTRLARLARLEGLETEQIPTVIENHNCKVVSGGDCRRGSLDAQGQHVTFYAATADEYEQASASYAQNRNIVVIQIDPRCIDFN